MVDEGVMELKEEECECEIALQIDNQVGSGGRRTGICGGGRECEKSLQIHSQAGGGGRGTRR